METHTIDSAEAVLVAAWRYHDRQAELHAEYGDGPEGVDHAQHDAAALKLQGALVALAGSDETARTQVAEVLEAAHRTNVRQVHGE